MRISDWSSDVCSSDLPVDAAHRPCTALERRIDASAAGDVAMKVGGATWPRFVRSFGHLVAEIVEHVEAGHARAFPNKCTDDFRANSPDTPGHNSTLVPHLHRLVILSAAASDRRSQRLTPRPSFASRNHP